VAGIRKRYAAVQALHAEGIGIRAIARELGLDRKTARRHVQAASAEELIARTTSRQSLLDEYKPYLRQRWNQVCTNVSLLAGGLRERGYRGSAQTIYLYLRPFRVAGKTPRPRADDTEDPPRRLLDHE
jgi:transposase